MGIQLTIMCIHRVINYDIALSSLKDNVVAFIKNDNITSQVICYEKIKRDYHIFIINAGVAIVFFNYFHCCR